MDVIAHSIVLAEVERPHPDRSERIANDILHRREPHQSENRRIEIKQSLSKIVTTGRAREHDEHAEGIIGICLTGTATRFGKATACVMLTVTERSSAERFERLSTTIDFKEKGVLVHRPHFRSVLNPYPVPDHPALRDRGIAPQTARFFGIGYCARGYCAGRIAIPLHDEENRLVGYAGRLLDPSTEDAKTPLYIYPEGRERKDQVLDFDRTLLVYNVNRLERPMRSLVLTQDFPSVWWLHQAGIPNSVALMDCDCTEPQMRIILNRIDATTRLVILPTGDREGELFAETIFAILGRNRWVRCVDILDGAKPTDLAPSDLVARLPV